MYETVLVGADGSATARQAVKVAAEIAGLHQGALHVVTTYERKSVSTGNLPAADALLSDLSAMIKQFGLEPVVHAATGSPEDAIIRVAEREQADLIVVGNKGMQGARRLLGSIPNSIAHNAPCSVLIVDTIGAD